MSPDRTACEALDREDPLAPARDRFALAPDLVYLDGNSLGALPLVVSEVMERAVSAEWGRDLIRSWNDNGWIDLPRVTGDRIGRLIGAAPGQVIAADSISLNLFKLVSAALEARPGRRVILSTRDNFPTDLYMVQGLARLLGPDRCKLRLVEASEIDGALDDTVALLMLSHVDFRSGRLFDIPALTRVAHDAGALALWDLAHSAGCYPLNLDVDAVDLAVGCGYKYLNGGPGAPAFLYVAERHQQQLRSPLTGWMGHRAPFDFSPRYEPAEGIAQFSAGTPAILAMKALDAALDLWRDLDIHAVRQKSVALTSLFIELIDARPELGELALASPREAQLRGSQVSYSHRDGYAIMQALIAGGVIGDFRDPDLMRFGFSPLYNRFVDVWDAVERMSKIVRQESYRSDEFSRRRTVT